MRVESQAGNFVLTFDGMEPGEGEVVITGRMGIWEAKTHVSLSEFFRILFMTLKPRMLLFLIKALFGGGRRREGAGEAR